MDSKAKGFIVSLAKKEGNHLLRFFKQNSSSRELRNIRSSVKDISTKYDKIIDKNIIKAIKSKFPNHNILTEESGFLNKH